MEKLKAIVSQVISGIDVSYSEDFFEDGLDSMGVMTIINLIQNEYKIEISPEDITADNFLNLKTLEEMVKKYM